MDADSTKDVCKKKCETTKNCVGYIFSPQECSTAALPLCWLKSKMDGNGVETKCRNAQKIGIPAINQPDIPSKWGLSVNASMMPLPKYPRPQMVRGAENASFREFGSSETWTNLNGLWEFEKVSESSTKPPFNRTLNSSILVPFPVESCLSGVAPMSSNDVVKEMWYRLTFKNLELQGQRALLKFGAVDWQTEVFVNTISVMNNTGGYNSFEADITDVIDDENEILIHVFDPSDDGVQPNGKQRISAIDNPGGDTYSPNSGIWQTVWLEYVPEDYLTEIRRSDQNSLTTLNVSAVTSSSSSSSNDDEILFEVFECGSPQTVLVSGKARSEEWIALEVPNPKLWSPDVPYLYDLRVSYKNDDVLSYFGLRSFELETFENNITRPVLNGNQTLVYVCVFPIESLNVHTITTTTTSTGTVDF